MALKTTLQELLQLFGRSAGNEKLDKNVRAFAAQLTILTAHTQRLEGLIKQKDAEIAELATLIIALKNPTTEVTAPAPTNGAPVPEQQGGEEQSEEDEAEAMAAKVQAETEAEARALAAQKGVTPIRSTPAADGAA